MSPNSMPDSMQDRALRTNLLDMDRSIWTRTWTPIGLSSPEQDIVLDVKMITKMIKQGVLEEITILICDAPNDGKFRQTPVICH